MSSKQTRRSVSISGELYKAMKSYCEKNDRSASDFVETEMRRVLKLPQRVVSAQKKEPNADKCAKKKIRKEEEADASFPEALFEEAAKTPSNSESNHESTSSMFDSNGKARGSYAVMPTRPRGNVLTF